MRALLTDNRARVVDPHDMPASRPVCRRRELQTIDLFGWRGAQTGELAAAAELQGGAAWTSLACRASRTAWASALVQLQHGGETLEGLGTVGVALVLRMVVWWHACVSSCVRYVSIILGHRPSRSPW